MKLSCVASKFAKTTHLYKEFINLNIFTSVEDSDVIVCLGGDGFMLHCIHKYLHLKKPFYGINYGSLGFLLNENKKGDIIKNISNALEFKLHPIQASFISYGERKTAIAFNEIYALRSGPVASHFVITINNVERINKLVADGILVATPVGSTAYNRSCGGHIIPLNTNLLAITPINPFIPNNWKGATIDDNYKILIKNNDIIKRKTKLYCDFHSFDNIKEVEIHLNKEISATILFDRNNDLDNKIIKAQFNQI